LVRFFDRWQIVRFDQVAVDKNDELRRQRIRIGTQDLKIAAICLRHDATLLSSNLRDFERIPSLRVEDWIHA
jgi:tRNA(fMet)-specific endonuclease VapC